jgi:hypothetical protein
MPHAKPFHRNYRGMLQGYNSGYSQWAYILDRTYAIAPEHYVRAFLLIQSDLIKLFEFIEPADENLTAYSFRTHELLIRSCIEVEANFKAILKENIYNPRDRHGEEIPESRWNIHNYRLVNNTHHLSSYRVQVPIWSGEKSTFTPFADWSIGQPLTWYQAYNKSKHDRHEQFKSANFATLLNAVAGLVVLLSSQFGTQDFSPKTEAFELSGGGYYSGESAIGDFFRIEFPSDWVDDELYDFDWCNLREQADRFNKIDYNLIS